MAEKPTVKFDPIDIKNYLDGLIHYWRKERDKGTTPPLVCRCYIDAYQSVRVSIFGKLLPKEVKNES